MRSPQRDAQLARGRMGEGCRGRVDRRRGAAGHAGVLIVLNVVRIRLLSRCSGFISATHAAILTRLPTATGTSSLRARRLVSGDRRNGFLAWLALSRAT